MKIAVDLHIHSCVSPCADMDMTPNNLVTMAYLKGLDAIAVSDHNTAKNLPACKAVADARGILLVPAIEVESREEVHVLCYFTSVEAAVAMGGYVYDFLPDIENVPAMFGEQTAMNDDDEPIYTERKLLIQATELTIDEIALKCRALGGVPVPAHINRTSNSLIACLGFIPDEPEFTSVEVYRSLPVKTNVDAYHVIYSSDAHRLEDIFERDNFIGVEEKSVEGIVRYLAAKK